MISASQYDTETRHVSVQSLRPKPSWSAFFYVRGIRPSKQIVNKALECLW